MKSSDTKILSTLKLSRPYLFIIAVYLLGLLFFGLFRTLFAFIFYDTQADISSLDIVWAFFIGVRFDTVIILYILFIPLIVLPWLSLKLKAVRIGIISYLSFMFTFTFLMLIGDMSYYRLANAHLNYLALDYLKDGTTAWKLVLAEPIFIVAIIGWIMVSFSFGYLVYRLIKLTKKRPERFSWAGQLLWMVLLAALTVVGVRGRTQLSPMRWGVAYFSDNHFVNQLGLNGIWSFVQTFKAEDGDPRLTYLTPEQRFPFVTYEKALSATQEMLAGPDDDWHNKDSSMTRTTRQPENKFGFKPNVVIVLMESFSGRLTGVLGSDQGLTPNFDRLAQQGILFDNFYAGGERTSYGMAATLCSAPALPGRSVQKRYGAAHPFRAISEILRDRNYVNVMVYGGDKVFDNINGFYKSKKYDAVYGDDDFGQEFVFAKWGIPDQIIFDRIIEMADSISRPFQITMLTLSNHEPFDLPDSSVQVFQDDSYLSKSGNALAYADFALGEFIDNFSKLPLYDSTIFVFVADHARYKSASLAVNPSNFHIPLLIYAPALIGDSGQIISTVSGQVDIIPTLMGLFGGDYEHASWGRDLLAIDSADSGFALLRVADRVGWIEDRFIYIEPLGGTPALYKMSDLPEVTHDLSKELPEQFSRLQNRMRLYLQAAEQLATPGMIGITK